MSVRIENLFDKFKDLTQNFQLIPNADRHVILIPRRNPAFLVGKALMKVYAQTDFPSTLRESRDIYAVFNYINFPDNSRNLDVL